MSELHEDDVLNHIDEWDKQNQFAEIVDYIQQLPSQLQTDEVLSELARAYNNLYWADKCAENLPFLEKSVEILMQLEPKLGNTSAWHYRIGYAYYFLERLEQAIYHLTQAVDVSHSEDLLRQIDWMKRHHIGAVEASVYHTHYLAQDVLNYLKEHLPDVYRNLKNGVDEQALMAFEQTLGCRLPNEFKQLHLVFSGQTNHQILGQYSHFDYFVGLDEILAIQQQWQQRLVECFGKDWHLEPLTEQRMQCADWVKAQWFSPKWIPIAVNEYGYICMDLDPIYQEDYGQIIHVVLYGDDGYGIFYQCSAVQDFLVDVLESLNTFKHLNFFDMFDDLDNEKPILFS